MIKVVNDHVFEERTFNSDGFVLAAFISKTSIPCSRFLQEFRKAVELLQMNDGFTPPGGIEFLIIDVDENPSETEFLKITAVPTTLLFRKGKRVACWEGPCSSSAIVERTIQAVHKNA